jgi:outer membrane autotransporter protein
MITSTLIIARILLLFVGYKLLAKAFLRKSLPRFHKQHRCQIRICRERAVGSVNAVMMSLGLFSFVLGAPGAALAANLPTGGQVVSGDANNMIVTQGSHSAIVNWASFDDGQVTFVTPTITADMLLVRRGMAHVIDYQEIYRFFIIPEEIVGPLRTNSPEQIKKLFLENYSEDFSEDFIELWIEWYEENYREGLYPIGEPDTEWELLDGNIYDGNLSFDFNHSGYYDSSPYISGSSLEDEYFPTSDPDIEGHTINKLVKKGAGNLRLDRANSYSGGTLILDGNLSVNHVNALSSGKVTLDGGNLVVYSAQEINGTIEIGEGLDWHSGSIVYYDTGYSPENGDLLIKVDGNFTNGGNGGNFDFSQVEALDQGTYKLVDFNGSTNFTEANLTHSHGPNTSLDASFSMDLENREIVINIIGAESSGESILNSGGVNTPMVADFKINKPIIEAIGKENRLKSLIFESKAILKIEEEGVLHLSSGSLNLAELNSTSEINGGKLFIGGTGGTPENLVKSGLGNLKIGSDVEVSGKLLLQEGLLALNGNVSISDNFVVESGGTLGGEGIITTPILAVSGRLAPGNSPGTLNVSGDVDLNSSSTLEIEIETDSNYDRLHVSGNVDLDGTILASTWNDGSISVGNPYDVITADQITGKFSDYQAPEGFRMRFVNQGKVGTLLFAPLTYTQYALTQSQRNIASVLDSYHSNSFSTNGTETDSNRVSYALDLLPESSYPSAFEQIMPSFYQTHAESLLNNYFNQSMSVLNRLSLFHEDNGFTEAFAQKNLWRYWAKYDFSNYESNILRENSSFHNEIDSFALGADYLLEQSLTIGFFANRDKNKPKSTIGSHMEDDTFSFGVYSSYSNSEGYYFNTVASYAKSDIETTRSINFSNINRSARSLSDADQIGLGITLGRDFKNNKFIYGPFAHLSFSKLTMGGITETGADILNLKIDEYKIESFRSKLGGRIAYSFDSPDFAIILPEFRFSWMHDFREKQRLMNTYLDGGSGTHFQYLTPSLDRDSFVTLLGVSALSRKNLSMSIFYNVNSNDSGYDSDSVSLNMGYSF